MQKNLTTNPICGAASVVCGLLLVAAGCGHRGSTETSAPPNSKDPKGKQDNRLEMPDGGTEGEKNGTTGGLKNVWAAFENNLLLRRYDATGKLTGACDLSRAPMLADISASAASAGISALGFADKTTLLALVDPGTAGERIVAVDVKGETPSCAVTPWFEQHTGFSGITSNRIIAFKPNAATEYLRIFVPRENGIDRFTWSNTGVATRTIGPGDTPFVPTTVGGACTVGSITGIGMLGDGENRALLMLSSGEGGTTLNVVTNLMGGAAGRPQCISSIDYAASGQTTNKNDIPIHAVQMPDKRIYVLYRNTTEGAKVVRYDFNGSSLQSPVTVSQDTDDLGYRPRAMVAMSGNSLLLAAGDFITHIDTVSGKLIRRWQEAPLTSFTSALAVEP